MACDPDEPAAMIGDVVELATTVYGAMSVRTLTLRFERADIFR